MRFFYSLSLNTKLGAACVAIIIGLGLAVAMVNRSASNVAVNGPLFNEIIKGKDLIADVLPPPAYIIEANLYAHEIATLKDDAEREKMIESFRTCQTQYDERIEHWQANLPEGQLKEALLKQSQETAREYFRIVNEELIPATQANEFDRAEKIADEQLVKLFEEHRNAIVQVVEHANVFNEAITEDAVHQIGAFERFSWCIVGALATVSLLGSWFGARAICRRVNRVKEVAQAISAGQFDQRIAVKGSDEIDRSAKELSNASAALESSVSRTIHSMEAAMRNDYSQIIRDELPGEFDRMRKALNSMLTTLDEQRKQEARNQELERERNEQERRVAEDVQRRVSVILDVVNAVAEGRFDVEIPELGTDPVGQVGSALRTAVNSMRDALIEVRNVSSTVATAADELTAASQEISSSAQEQASSLEETASSLEEITSTVKQNSDNAQQARQLATGSRDVAEKGGQVVNDAIEAMNAINQASSKIANIITAIDEIAFQTNLLALNAAVEAARAGEQGRGFAVVAGEVRNLAQRSASAAKEIKSLIQDSGRKVEHGAELVDNSGATLQEIVASVKRVTDIVSEIAAASKEQLTGIEQVNKAVAQMDRATQSNASQTEELAGTATTLLGHAQQLSELANRFRLGNESKESASHARSTSGASGKPRRAPSRHARW